MTEKKQIEFLRKAQDYCNETGYFKYALAIKQAITDIEETKKLQATVDSFIYKVAELEGLYIE